MSRRSLFIVAISIAVVVLASLAVLYESGFFSPQGSRVLLQRDIEQFATALAVADGKVFIMDELGNVYCFYSQSGESLWN